MSTTERPAQPAEKRSRYDVESLLAVAVEVFGERGYDGTSMDDLARAAGISKSSFYHHVKGKEELLERSLDRALGGLFAALETAESDDGPAVKRLEGLLRGSVRVLVRELPHVRLLLRVRGNTETERAALARRREFDHRVTALVGAAEAEGDLRSAADPGLTARLLFGLINSLTEWYRPGGGLGESELADAVVDLALGGLRVRAT